MSWQWHSAAEHPDAVLPRGEYVVVVLYASEPGPLLDARAELRRHMIIRAGWPTSVPGVFVEHDPEPAGRLGWRRVVFGEPYRDLRLGRLHRQLRQVRGWPIRALVGARTGSDSLAEFMVRTILEDGAPVSRMADAAAAAGGGVVGATAGAGDAIAGVGEGLERGLPAAGAGVSDALAGTGDALAGVGAGLRSAGAGARAAPFATVALLGGGLLVWAVLSTGAVRVKVGG